uniref:Rho/rac guanine nucleotide exchange factor (GEF) 18a n=1 Tax=Neolamprologus brichardi TaxID=32507 RepID=A0A3Q4GYJ2_NEOBR
MTATPPQKHQNQPLSSYSNTNSHYTLLQLELEADAQNLVADSWSLTVDQNYLKNLSKEEIKRQDIIYELIKTEVHLVHTLKILLGVFMHELRQSQLIEEGRLKRLFLGIESLLVVHEYFLKCLKMCRNQSQEEGNPINYQISQITDVLISQFSGSIGDQMVDFYGMFCGHRLEADHIYKDLIQNNKRLQALDRKIRQLPLVRRLGISDCLLLVTQRITKYPVLVERLLQNIDADTDDHRSLSEALECIKNTIAQVNAQVKDYEKAARVREIGYRLEPKSVGRLNGGEVIRREDLIQGNRKLVHEGAVTWKSSGKQKDVHAVLLSDVLLLLQEKDQKFVFAAVDNKPPVISLERLIVREVAMEEKAIFLICARTVGLPEMYEIHMGSREERIMWEAILREAAFVVFCCSSVHLKERDDRIKDSLTEKQQLFAALYKHVTGQETPCDGLHLVGSANDLQQREMLLNSAIGEGEGATEMESQNQRAATFSNALYEYEKQRSLEKQREELNSLSKQQAQLREEQQHWEKEKERLRRQMEVQEAQLKQKEEECRKLEEKLSEEKAELDVLKKEYQQDLERLRETTRSLGKEKERLEHDKERLDKFKKKFMPSYDDPTQEIQSPSTLTSPLQLYTKPLDSLEIPPKVPPRRESICIHPAKPSLLSNLVSTTNQALKPAPMQQQIPTKLAKEKDKFSKKKTHKRAQSAGQEIVCISSEPPGLSAKLSPHVLCGLQLNFQYNHPGYPHHQTGHSCPPPSRMCLDKGLSHQPAPDCKSRLPTGLCAEPPPVLCLHPRLQFHLQQQPHQVC